MFEEEDKEKEIGDQNLAVVRPPFYVVGARTNTAPTGKNKRNKRIKAIQEENELSLREKADS